jgi:hypothetical protein
MPSEAEIELRLQNLEKEKDSREELLDMLIRNVNVLEGFRKQFKNGNGFVPQIIKGLTANFEKLFETHKREIKMIVSRIPCSKLIGQNCDFRIIGKDDPVPDGWKEIKE